MRTGIDQDFLKLFSVIFIAVKGASLHSLPERIWRMKADRPNEVCVFVGGNYKKIGGPYFWERTLTPLGFGGWR